MSFEFTYQKDDKQITLNDGTKQDVISTINSNFKKWDDLRYSNLVKSNRLIDEIFFKNKKNKHTKEDAWKSNVKMGKAYMLFQTQKAVIWKNIYSNVKSNEIGDFLRQKIKWYMLKLTEA